MQILQTLIIILTSLWAVCVLREPRSFWNALLLMADLCVVILASTATSGLTALIVIFFIIIVAPLFFLATAFFLMLNGFVVVKREGLRLKNLLSFLTGLAMVAGGAGTVAGLYYSQDSPDLQMLLWLGLCLEFYIAFSFVSLLLYSLLYTCLPKRVRCDYIIVHGCGLKDGEKVTPLLKGRVDKAVRVYKRGKGHAKIVVSGGKGGDEKISEAAAMCNYLLETGFPKEDIILEEQSATTYENLKNVRDMLDQNGVRHRYIFVTNNYHLFRTSLFARKLKMRAVGVGCRTAFYYWPSAFIREYIAIMAQHKWVFVAILLLWAMVFVRVHI